MRTKIEYVYLMQAGDFFKIGRSMSPMDRLTQYSSMPIEAVMIHAIECQQAKRLESAFHQHYASKWVRSEWFRLEKEDIATFCSIDSCPTERDYPIELPTVKFRIDHSYSQPKYSMVIHIPDEEYNQFDQLCHDVSDEQDNKKMSHSDVIRVLIKEAIALRARRKARAK